MADNDVTVLHGHHSPETAHLTFAYPFGRTRCVRREWLERALKGQAQGHFRFVTQTTTREFNYEYTRLIETFGEDAANEWAREIVAKNDASLWNAPKPSTYHAYAIMVQEPLPDGTGRLSTTYRTLRAYDRAEDILSFKALVYDQLDDGQRKFVDAIEGYSRRNDPAQWERAAAAQRPTIENPAA